MQGIDVFCIADSLVCIASRERYHEKGVDEESQGHSLVTRTDAIVGEEVDETAKDLLAEGYAVA